MKMYEIKNDLQKIIIRTEDMAAIPFDSGNKDFKSTLKI